MSTAWKPWSRYRDELSPLDDSLEETGPYPHPKEAISQILNTELPTSVSSPHHAIHVVADIHACTGDYYEFADHASVDTSVWSAEGESDISDGDFTVSSLESYPLELSPADCSSSDDDMSELSDENDLTDTTSDDLTLVTMMSDLEQNKDCYASDIDSLFSESSDVVIEKCKEVSTIYRGRWSQTTTFLEGDCHETVIRNCGNFLESEIW